MRKHPTGNSFDKPTHAFPPLKPNFLKKTNNFKDPHRVVHTVIREKEFQNRDQIDDEILKQKEFRKQQNQRIASLDPLQMDESIPLIPQYNHHQDIVSLERLLYHFLPSPECIDAYHYPEAAAAMRDIGILLGSLKRHGIEPAQAVPHLESILFRLSHKLDMPPRDTLISYTIWNPQGKRQRTYTHLPDESQLIHSIRMAMGDLEAAIYGMKKLYELDPRSPQFLKLGKQIMENYRAMVNGIVNAKRHVSPKVFAIELRHYYEDITLNGKSYLGPGAVEMPAFIFDHILWSCENNDLKYKQFKEGYIPYIFPELRSIYHKLDGQESLTQRLCHFLDSAEKEDYSLVLSANILLQIFALLKSFRMPHKRLANSAYETEEAKHSHGSGGYGTDILTDIIHLMTISKHHLETSLENYHARIKPGH